MLHVAAGVYLHIPFCRSRCSYCDFATDVYRSADGVERYVSALCAEVDAQASRARAEIDTVYFGGGTPSLLTPQQLERILRSVRNSFDLLPDAEITVEMNPATVTHNKLSAFRQVGVNRASFGVQTFDDRMLRLLARAHDAADARETFAMLRHAGFKNVSFDLIAGLPGQTVDDWDRNLDEALALAPEHLSLYLLEVHAGTPLAEQIKSGRQPRPDDDLAAQMYELMVERLTANGYQQYEISNFARPGFESKHNTKYWQMEPVYGFGVSAHSFDGLYRYSNERDTAKYVASIEAGRSPEVMRELTDLASETAFLGLRMESGIDLTAYSTAFGIDLLRRYRKDLAPLTDNGLIETAGDRLRLTPRGKLFSNEVFAVFVS
jgi:oxygen-independent coproporphyrinogen-3 oxidase